MKAASRSFLLMVALKDLELLEILSLKMAESTESCLEMKFLKNMDISHD